MPWLLAATAILVVFYQLGSAALFEPDEGRNAEKAREILLLGDWLTPHENFQPVLDKPMFFYWLIALSYKIFGVSEWAARLPSALAALGCVFAVYSFAHVHWGKAQALWSGLILLTSLEFFLFARLVIFDMTLTLLLTVALSAFYQASHCEVLNRRRLLCLVMYGSLGAATLIKGLIGVVAPGMVIFCYLLLTKRWSVLRRIYLAAGVLLFFAIVLPWYLAMGAHHDGYLRYFFWHEHFGRFTSNEFDRAEPWYYFIFVVLIGLFPWSFLAPFLVADLRRRAWEDRTLFLVLWAGLPFLFFSASASKLPHYILPIFPALAMLIGSGLVSLCDRSLQLARKALSLTWVAYGIIVLYFLIGFWQPAILPHAIVHGISGMPYALWFYGVVIVVLPLLVSIAKFSPPGRANIYLSQAISMGGFLIFTAHIMIEASSVRSAKALADAARPMLGNRPQVVIYDTYLAGLAFYLQSDEPIWVVTHDTKKRSFLGNYYAFGQRAVPTTNWGKALIDVDEFSRRWRSTARPLLVLTRAKNRGAFEAGIGASAKILASLGGYIWLTKN